MQDQRDGLNRSQIQELMDFARTLAEHAHSIVLRSSADEYDIHNKSATGDPVTTIDLQIEEEWARRIKRRYPEHNIVGEETGCCVGHSDMTWVLDPIDGTDDLIRNSPLFGSIIAVLYKGDPIVGVIDHPRLNLRCSAAYGSENEVSGTTMRTFEIRNEKIGEAVVLPAYDDFRKLDKCDEIISAIGREVPNQRVYRNVYGHTMVAIGAMAAGLEVDVALWDLAATRLLVEQSNGKFLIFRDTGGNYGERRFGAIFGQPRLVDRLSRILGQYGRISVPDE